ASWKGIHQGRTIVDLRVMWRKGRTLAPDWKVEHGYVVEVQGMPNVRTKLTIAPPADLVAHSMKDSMVLGMVITSLPAINAIPAVCAAAPGIVTYVDLPLVTARGFVREGR
ncbi:MAG: dihydrodipicolinate reductase, partial [Acidimicrobiales bacterium]|nr:dihydrodipicolinate reductase [Acidimicrobiales bacterium]